MNERIKELYEECSNSVYANGYGYDHYRRVTNYEKFAELIVRECARVAAEVGESYVKLGYLVPHECSDEIKKHFGVK